MNYFSHHIGDYLRETAHLTFAEDAAYRRLIDRYYTQESPLINNVEVICRIVRAITVEEKQAVETVLAEFFTLADEKWSHKRCDKELADYKTKAATSRENGCKGGRPKKNADFSQSNPSKTELVISGNLDETKAEFCGNPRETLTNNQEPNTKNNKPNKKAGSSSESCILEKVVLQKDFVVSPAVKAWAGENGYSNLEAHFAYFVGRARAKGYAYVDWDQALKNAIRENWAKIPMNVSQLSVRPSRHTGSESLDYSEGVEKDGRIN